MASSFHRETVFLALTRPQMFAGVTYSFFVINAIVCAEVFLIFKSFWAIAAGAGAASGGRGAVPARAALL